MEDEASSISFLKIFLFLWPHISWEKDDKMIFSAQGTHHFFFRVAAFPRTMTLHMAG